MTTNTKFLSTTDATQYLEFRKGQLGRLRLNAQFPQQAVEKRGRTMFWDVIKVALHGASALVSCEGCHIA